MATDRSDAHPAAQGRPIYGSIYMSVPETRWFQQYVLRRRERRWVIFTGLIEEADLERAINQPYKASFTLKDPFQALLDGQP